MHPLKTIRNVLFLGFVLTGLVACGGSTSASNDLNNISQINSPGSSNLAITPGNTTGIATLNWTPPTENTDNSSLADLNGYKIRYGSSPDTLTSTITINNIDLTSYVIEDLSINTTYYFSITAVNALNTESSYSNIVSKHISG